MVNKISEKDFAQVKEQGFAVVDFSATWCGPCKMLAPVLEDVSSDMEGKVAFYNVDIDENPNLTEEYGIMSVPSLIMLKDGVKIDMHVGFSPKDAIVSFIDKNM